MTSGQMSIESVDFVKSYYSQKRSITTLVRVIDENNEPIDKARVRVDMKQPEGYTVSRTCLTDHDGIASFEIEGTDSGRLEVGIKNVQHPCYKIDSASLMIQSRYTNV